MKKNNIVKSNIEFNNIMKIGKKYYSDLFFIYVYKNNFSYNRYGISVSKKVGNAVIRNKYKRRIKDIIDDYKFMMSGYDFIIISRPKLKECDYETIKSNIINLFNMIGEKHEK